MAITLTGSNGLFTRLGKLGKILYTVNTHQAALPALFESFISQYDASLRVPVDGVPRFADLQINRVADYLSQLAAVAQNTLIEMVKADKPDAARTLQLALTELIAQMVAASASVEDMTVSASATAFSANVGDGTAVITEKMGNGDAEQLLIIEDSRVRCTADGSNSTIASGRELFRYYGEGGATSVWNYLFPSGSGQQTDLTAIDATQDGTAATTVGNVLINGDFEDFTTNAPDSWTINTGTAGTHIDDDASTFYSGAKSLKFIGNGSTLASIQQIFTPSLNPITNYAFCLRAKVDVVPAAGVVKLELIDADGNVLDDLAGTANEYSIDVTGLTTSWVAVKGTFRTPRVTSGIGLRIRQTTAISSGTSMFIDHLAMGRCTTLYAGGPAMAIFSGNSPFAREDGFTLNIDNDMASASYAATWQFFFDRFFPMRSYGLRLPFSSSPTIADTLITS